MPEYKIISREELKNKLDAGDNFLLIDVLSSSSFDAIRIPGSINVDVHEPSFIERMGKVTKGGKNIEIVVYCSSPTCQMAPSAARQLIEAEYKNVYVYEAGISEWKDAGYPMEGSTIN